MANDSKKDTEKESGVEKVSRWGRNINFIGAAAIGRVAAALPGPNVVLSAWALLNFGQGTGFELLRRSAKKSKRIAK